MTNQNWVYILSCGDGSLYTGWTNDLVRRILIFMFARKRNAVNLRCFDLHRPICSVLGMRIDNRSSALF